MIAEQFFEGIEVIRRPENGGFAPAVNAGIKAARGRYIAILNNDAKPEPGWLSAAVKVFGRLADVGGVASKVLTFDKPPQVYSIGIGLTRNGYAFNIGQGTAEDGRYNKGRYVLGASGAASVWRREVFEIVGGFDEDLAHYLEDVDLSLRAQLEGIRCYYEPGAVVQHHGGGAAGGQNTPLMVRQVARNGLGFLVKDIPRSILRQHLLRVGGGLLGQLLYFTARGRGASGFAGMWEGVQLVEQMIAKRKRVLGHQKVPDQRILELMLESETLLQEMAEQLPPLSSARLRMMGMV
jgi:GT2 family glycosyltransferase